MAVFGPDGNPVSSETVQLLRSEPILDQIPVPSEAVLREMEQGFEQAWGRGMNPAQLMQTDHASFLGLMRGALAYWKLRGEMNEERMRKAQVPIVGRLAENPEVSSKYAAEKKQARVVIGVRKGQEVAIPVIPFSAPTADPRDVKPLGEPLRRPRDTDDN